MNSLSLLREYLRLVLISEGKVENLAKQNPNIPVIDLADSDPTPTKKLLWWMVKQVSKGADVERVKKITSRFAKDGDRLWQKDINLFDDIDELEFDLDSLGASKRSEKIQTKSGAVKIFEDNACIVLRIDTREAAQLYGKGTRWCITSANRQHYELYRSSNALFYYVLRKEPVGDDLDKVAIAVMRKDDNKVKKILAFNEVDKEMTPENANVSERALAAIQSDVMSQPKTFLASVKTGKGYSDEELLSHWENLKKVKEKIEFLCSIKQNYQKKKLLSVEKNEEMREIILDLVSGKAHTLLPDHIMWRNKSGQLHRDNDKPASITGEGSMSWYQNGKQHREGDKPANIDTLGIKTWYKNGKRHRDGDRPAIVWPDGTKEWYKNGEQYFPKGIK